MASLNIDVNGHKRAIDTDETTSLLVVLREHLHLTGAKPGCGEGECGACTVLLNGHAVRSCITPVREVNGGLVQTIEGLADNRKLRRVQQAFLDHSAFQCGFCTPGMIIATIALLNKIPNPTVENIRTELNGNICRCGAYSRIIKAVRQAAESTQNA